MIFVPLQTLYDIHLSLELLKISFRLMLLAYSFAFTIQDYTRGWLISYQNIRWCEHKASNHFLLLHFEKLKKGKHLCVLITVKR